MLSLSKIGFGSLTISGVWGKTDDLTSIQAIQKALEENITWIDTAPIYGFGHSEFVIGKAIKNRRDRCHIASKCGLFFGKNNKAQKDLSPNFIFQDLENSLKRLQVSEIDLYQCHWPDPNIPIEESWQAMKELIKQGKVKEIGVCNFSIELLERIQPIHPVYSLQIPYSIIQRQHEHDLIPYCIKNNIKVFAYGALHLGLLSGKHDLSLLSSDDRRLKSQEWSSETEMRLYLAFVEKMKILAKKKDVSVAQLAIAWVLNNPNISSVIAGMRTPEQAYQNAHSLNIKLSKEDQAFLNFPSYKKALQLNFTLPDTVPDKKYLGPINSLRKSDKAM